MFADLVKDHFDACICLCKHIAKCAFDLLTDRSILSCIRFIKTLCSVCSISVKMFFSKHQKVEVLLPERSLFI